MISNAPRLSARGVLFLGVCAEDIGERRSSWRMWMLVAEAARNKEGPEQPIP